MNRHSEILQNLTSELVDIFYQSVCSIILYGSVARGDETADSDIDIAVIVKPYAKAMHDSMIDCVVDLELKYNKVLSVVLIDDEKYREWQDIIPFYVNVKKEGIILWQAA